uniref:Cystatin domain-containing protein n=1 Tax=Callithrix jacchus TaxID=9483 RepID=A0A8I3X380_CALJA|nr:cystatin-12-like [Callithrix jacchus]
MCVACMPVGPRLCDLLLALFGDDGRNTVGEWREALDRGTSRREGPAAQGPCCAVLRGVRAGKDVTGSSGDLPSPKHSRPLVPTLETAMWWKVPLLVGFFMLGTHVCSCKFVDTDKNLKYFASAVEYAVFQFNEDQEDEFAYKFLRVHRSQHKTRTWIYLMDLTMGRTVCKKHDEDIDNCPLQEGTEETMVRCTFIVDVRWWSSQFTLLNSTCGERRW